MPRDEGSLSAQPRLTQFVDHDGLPVYQRDRRNSDSSFSSASSTTSSVARALRGEEAFNMHSFGTLLNRLKLRSAKKDHAKLEKDLKRLEAHRKDMADQAAENPGDSIREQHQLKVAAEILELQHLLAAQDRKVARYGVNHESARLNRVKAKRSAGFREQKDSFSRPWPLPKRDHLSKLRKDQRFAVLGDQEQASEEALKGHQERLEWHDRNQHALQQHLPAKGDDVHDLTRKSEAVDELHKARRWEEEKRLRFPTTDEQPTGSVSQAVRDIGFGPQGRA